MQGIKPVKQKTVVFQVMEQLKEMIATGRLKPNDKVPNEYDLAEMFGVGRSTIREALKIFQYLGVVELRNPKGTFICESSNVSSEALLWSMLLGQKDMKNILELRLVMEHQGLWNLLVHHKDDRDLLNNTITLLRQEVVKIDDALKSGNKEQRAEADYDFHKHIIDVCQNDLFNALYKTMRSFSYKELIEAQESLSNETIIKDHNDLIEAILAGDYDDASEKYREHIRRSDPLFQKM